MAGKLISRFAKRKSELFFASSFLSHFSFSAAVVCHKYHKAYNAI
jgi:hypothetical protein